MSVRQRAATARECVARLDAYTKCLDAIQNLLDVSTKFGCYSQLPEEFTFEQKQTITTIRRDIQAVKADVAEMALYQAEKALKLEKETEGGQNA